MPLSLPTHLPGDYFLIVWDQEMGRWELQVDDAEGSTFNLGGDVQRLIRWFDRLDLRLLGESALDWAKEHGAAQAVFATGRVLPLADKTKAAHLEFKDKDDHERIFRHIPALG